MLVMLFIILAPEVPTEKVIFGFSLGELALIVAIITGIILPIIRDIRIWRKDWKDEHPIINLIILSIGAANTGNQQIRVIAHYARGKTPVTLYNPLVIFKKHGIQTFPFSLSDNLDYLDPQKRTGNYLIATNPYTDDIVVAVSMQDIGGKDYYSYDFPGEYKNTRLNRIKWKWSERIARLKHKERK